MPSDLPIRVLSDLHFAHPASLVQEIAQIEPLLEGTQKIVFNGDTVESRSMKFRAESRRHLAALSDFCSEREIEPVLINGNHDPEVSALDHVELMDDRLLVLHGHALFPEITPWGREARQLGENHFRALEEFSRGGEIEMEDRLRAVREACLRTEGTGRAAASRWQWMAAVFCEIAHPRRPVQVLRAWRNGPELAAAFAARNRPRVQCVLVGHTHLPGFWMRGEKLIVNTGAYMPWFGRRIVDIGRDSLCVRAVVRDGRYFRPGKELFRWAPKADETVRGEEMPTRSRNK